MGNVQSLSHSKWECIYHITWIPKYRKKKIYKALAKCEMGSDHGERLAIKDNAKNSPVIWA